MKKTMQIVAAAMFAVIQWCAMAATIEVDTVAKLVAAVQSAGNGDTIVIKSGVTYTFGDDDYCEIDGSVKNLLKVTAQNVSIVGESDTSRKDWTDGAEPVILNVNGKGRLFKFTSGGCSVRNVVITGCNAAYSTYSYDGIVTSPWASAGNYSAMFTNCVFRGNATTGESYVGVRCALFDCCFTNNSIWVRNLAYGCDFLQNTGKFQYLSYAHGCRFEGNNPGNYLMYNCETLSNCWFVSNTSSLYMMRNKDIDVSIIGCRFVDNTPGSAGVCLLSNSENKANDVLLDGCRFERNVASILRMADSSGANPLKGKLTVTNCFFSGNTASIDLPGHYSSSGKHPKVLLVGSFGDEDKCMVVDSEFVGTKTTESVFGQCTVYGAKAVRCKFLYDADALPGFNPAYGTYNEAAEASTLEECDISSGELRDCVVDRCTIHDVTNKVYAIFKDYVRVTNTLISCCKNSGGFYSAPNKLDAEFVNCTIVSNDMITFDFQWATTSTNDCRFVNSVFNGNCFTTIASDIVMRNNDRALYYWNNYVDFSHTYYGAFVANGRLSQAVFDAKKGEDLLAECVDPKFVKDSSANAPYWSLSLKSPILCKGDPLDFSDSDLDLAGRQRLKDGEIDIGCYQCWLRSLGLSVIIK